MKLLKRSQLPQKPEQQLVIPKACLGKYARVKV
jgi:hypothetical protein